MVLLYPIVKTIFIVGVVYWDASYERRHPMSINLYTIMNKVASSRQLTNALLSKNYSFEADAEEVIKAWEVILDTVRAHKTVVNTVAGPVNVADYEFPKFMIDAMKYGNVFITDKSRILDTPFLSAEVTHKQGETIVEPFFIKKFFAVFWNADSHAQQPPLWKLEQVSSTFNGKLLQELSTIKVSNQDYDISSGTGGPTEEDSMYMFIIDYNSSNDIFDQMFVISGVTELQFYEWIGK